MLVLDFCIKDKYAGFEQRVIGLSTLVVDGIEPNCKFSAQALVFCSYIFLEMILEELY